MNNEHIFEKMNAFFYKFTKRDDINPNKDIFEAGLINSLFAMQLITFIEKEFDIVVDNFILGDDSFHTINGICEYISTQINAKSLS